MEQKNRFWKIFGAVCLTFAILILVRQISFAWTNPAQNPPGGSGNVTASAGNVGIGITNPGAKLDLNGSLLISSSTATITHAVRMVQNGVSAPGTYYVKLFDNAADASRKLSFKMTCWSNSEYGAEVDVFIPSYVYFYPGSYGGWENGIGPQITTRVGGLNAQEATFKNIHAVSAGTGDLQIWLEFYTSSTGRGISLSENPGSGAITWAGLTTSAPANIRKTVAFAQGAKNENGIVSRYDGNVGIGTTAPGFLLDVGNNAYGTSAIINVNAAASQQTGINFQSAGTSKWYMYRPAGSNDLRFWDGSDRITFQSGGNVGIGTTGPGALLDVFKSDSAIANDPGNSQIRATALGGTNARFTSLGYDTTINAGYIQAAEKGVAWRNLILEANGGNVGIGTTGPQAKLDVYNSWITPQSNVITDTAAAAGITWYTSTPTSYGIYRTSGAWTASTYQQLRINFDTGIQLGAGTGVGTGYDKSYVEIVNGKGLMVTSGNVGIGTTGPGSLLHLYAPTTSSVDFVKFSSADGGDIRVGKQLGLNNDAIFGTWSNNDVSLYANSAVAMTIKSGGNVGIGTTNPDAMLTLGANTGSHGYIRFRGQTINEGNIYHDATYGLHLDTSGNSLPIRIDGSALVLGMNGNVGIGTTNPIGKFNVNGGMISGAVYVKADPSVSYQSYYSSLNCTGEEYGQMVSGKGSSWDGGGIFLSNTYVYRSYLLAGSNKNTGGVCTNDNSGIPTTEYYKIYRDTNASLLGSTVVGGILDVNSITGAFIVPRMTTAQRDALVAVNGMIIYNYTTNQFNFRENGAWVLK